MLCSSTSCLAADNSATPFFVGQVSKVTETTVTNDQTIEQIELQILEGELTGTKLVIEQNREHLQATSYKSGDRLLIAHEFAQDGSDFFYIVDYSRRRPLYFLALLFAVLILLTGKQRGLRALLGLALSFALILYGILPAILGGNDPVLSTLLYAMLITGFGTYLVYGINAKASLAILATTLSLSLVGLLSAIFTKLSNLAGFAQEEALFLNGVTPYEIDLKGLLLAGFLIGALGVLDDITVSQTSTIFELHRANPKLKFSELYQHGLRVGIDHTASMVNTLFLAYAGASFPLLLLFSIKQEPFLSLSQILDHEVVATEIVRTLTGSIGLALAVPLSTLLAAFYISKFKHDQAS